MNRYIITIDNNDGRVQGVRYSLKKAITIARQKAREIYNGSEVRWMVTSEPSLFEAAWIHAAGYVDGELDKKLRQGMVNLLNLAGKKDESGYPVIIYENVK